MSFLLIPPALLPLFLLHGRRVVVPMILLLCGALFIRAPCTANAVGHCLIEKALGKSEPSPGASTPGALDVLMQFAFKTVDGLLKGTLLDELRGVVQSRVNAYKMPNYREKFRGS